MAEDYVSQNQHRADMAELRLELANSLASLDKRTELIAQDLIALRREVDDRFDRMGEQMTERFDRMSEQMTERFDRASEQMTERLDRTGEQIAELRQSHIELRQDMREMRQQMQVFQSNTQRQLWVIVLVVAAAIVTGVVKLVFFPTP